MLSAYAITAWARTHPWATADQVEQDLLLCRAMCAIATDPYLGHELVFRGGTALHKLHLPQPFRYSEDLDYVRRTATGIGQLTGRLMDLGRDLGFEVRSKMATHPKVLWRTTSQVGTPLRIKIEINTHELSPALAVQSKLFCVDSPWWSGEADIQTFQFPELIATKIRALYQRSKGRDLFDLWLALTTTSLSPAQVLAAFPPYRPVGFTSNAAITNLKAKLDDHYFRTDIDTLALQIPDAYNPDEAATLVITQLLSKVEVTAD